MAELDVMASGSGRAHEGVGKRRRLAEGGGAGAGVGPWLAELCRRARRRWCCGGQPIVVLVPAGPRGARLPSGQAAAAAPCPRCGFAPDVIEVIVQGG